MDESVKNSIWNYLIPLHYLEQVSSTFGRNGVEVSLTSHYNVHISVLKALVIDRDIAKSYNNTIEELTLIRNRSIDKSEQRNTKDNDHLCRSQEI